MTQCGIHNPFRKLVIQFFDVESIVCFYFILQKRNNWTKNPIIKITFPGCAAALKNKAHYKAASTELNGI